MSALNAVSLAPFIPSGRDYNASRQLFAELGFDEVWESDGYAGFRNGMAQFVLQRFDNAVFAGNLMIRINVPNLDTWWAAVSAKNLPARYPGVRIKPPTQFAWGREVHFIDLAGVCWHVGDD
jgi:catechol 2,3-dioxygenase-like lactoylglutathione lyase family enzyme